MMKEQLELFRRSLLYEAVVEKETGRRGIITLVDKSIADELKIRVQFTRRHSETYYGLADIASNLVGLEMLREN